VQLAEEGRTGEKKREREDRIEKREERERGENRGRREEQKREREKKREIYLGSACFSMAVLQGCNSLLLLRFEVCFVPLIIMKQDWVLVFQYQVCVELCNPMTQ
jgi:hypothetical protein